MAHLYVAELCTESYILLESPKLVIGRNSNKTKPWELIDNRLLLPYQELSRMQLELSYDGHRLNLANIGRNRVSIILQTRDSTGSEEKSSRRQMVIESNGFLDAVSPPCILSIHSYSLKDHYGTYYYGCSLFPPLDIISIGGMVAPTFQMLEEIDSLLSPSAPRSIQTSHLNIILSRYNCPQLVLAEFIDCTDPRILGPLMDGTKKVVDLEPYYTTLTDILNHIRGARSINGIELSIDPEIYKFEKPPCFPEHQMAYEQVCPQEHASAEYMDNRQSISTEFFLTDVTILSINAKLQSLFAACIPSQSQLNIDILEWAIADPKLVLEDGRLCSQPDLGRLRSYYSRHKYLLIVYEGSESQDWVSSILEPEADKNVLFTLIRNSMGVEKPIYIMSRKQFSGFVYHQDLDHLSHFTFPPSNSQLSHLDICPNEVMSIIGAINSEVEVSKEPSLRQSTPSAAPKHPEDEEVIDISDSESSSPRNPEGSQVKEPTYPSASQSQELPIYGDRKVIKVGLPVLRIINGYGVIDCNDVSMSIWRQLVDSLNSDDQGAYLAFRLYESDTEQS